MRAGLEVLQRLAQPRLGLAGIVAATAGLLAVGTSRMHEWVVMTDELLYAKLASHTGHTGSPLPVLHGVHVGFLGAVYPILLSPFYGTLDPVAAFEAAHIVNAVLFASAAVPAFLLARRVTSTGCALVVAPLVIAIPWAVGSAFLMSEAAAYPAFLWAVLALHAAVSEPSPRRDALAICGLALAYFTRPQFLFLVLVLPLAALLVSGPRGALSRHRLLAGAYAVAVLVVVPLATLGEAHRLLGDYGITATHGSLFPAGVWKSAALHLDVLAVGLGVVPFLLGAAWTYSSLRHASRRVRAFAALTALCLPLLPLEAASYDLRFGGPGVIRDRYVFYLAPLLLLATALSLRAERLPLVGIAVTTAFFAATAALGDFTPVPGLPVDSPGSVLNGPIHDEAAGLPPGVFVAACGAVLGVVCLGLAWLPRPTAALAVTAAVFAFGGSVTGYAFERLLTSRNVAGVPVTGQPRVRDWVDATLPPDSSAALVPYPTSRVWAGSAVLWWDVEFWNHVAKETFVDRGDLFTYTPFPARRLRFDYADGRFPGTASAPRYLVVADVDSRFDLAGIRVAANYGLSVLSVERPYRALWASRGLTVDGWTTPGRTATLRVYGGPGPTGRIHVSVNLDAPSEATGPTAYRLAGGGAQASGSVDPGGRDTVTVDLCVPHEGHLDLTLATGRGTRVEGPPLGPGPAPERTVGLHVSGAELHVTGDAC